MLYFYIYLCFINLSAVFICVGDKHRARRKRWRIPEWELLAIAALGGSVGMYLTMLLIRHKTEHLKFTVGLPIILVTQIILFIKFGISA